MTENDDFQEMIERANKRFYHLLGLSVFIMLRNKDTFLTGYLDQIAYVIPNDTYVTGESQILWKNERSQE